MGDLLEGCGLVWSVSCLGDLPSGFSVFVVSVVRAVRIRGAVRFKYHSEVAPERDAVLIQSHCARRKPTRQRNRLCSNLLSGYKIGNLNEMKQTKKKKVKDR